MIERKKKSRDRDRVKDGRAATGSASAFCHCFWLCCPRAVMAYVDHFTTTSRVNFQRQLSDGALVQWLWEETRVPKVVGLNPSTVYWMDIFHMYLL